MHCQRVCSIWSIQWFSFLRLLAVWLVRYISQNMCTISLGIVLVLIYHIWLQKHENGFLFFYNVVSLPWGCPSQYPIYRRSMETNRSHCRGRVGRIYASANWDLIKPLIWLLASSVPGYCLNQCWLTVNWTLGKNCGNFNQSTIFTRENENITLGLNMLTNCGNEVRAYSIQHQQAAVWLSVSPGPSRWISNLLHMGMIINIR